MLPLTWVLESDVLPASHDALRRAIRENGGQIVNWEDDWLTGGELPSLNDSPVVFHGAQRGHKGATHLSGAQRGAQRGHPP